MALPYTHLRSRVSLVDSRTNPHGYREVESKEFAVTQDTGIEALLAYIGLSEVNHIRSSVCLVALLYQPQSSQYAPRLIEYGATTVLWLGRAEHGDLLKLKIKPLHARVLLELAHLAKQ